MVHLLVPFSLCFGSMSGEFSQAMVRISVRGSQAKIPMARPDERDILYASEVYQKGAIRYLPYSNLAK